MPADYHIDRTHLRVTVTIAGAYAPEEIERCYAALLVDPGFVDGLDLVIDGRASHGSPATVALRARARRAGELKGRFSGRIALVAGSTHIEYALGRMYAVYAKEFGVAAQVFTSIPDAERWLDGQRASSVTSPAPPPAPLPPP